MKKIFLSLAALLAFGIASAQTDPKQVPQKDPVTTDPAAKKAGEVELQPDVIHKNDVNDDGSQSRKDKIITKDHVKSTPDPAITKDTINKKKIRKAKTKAKTTKKA